MSRVCECVCVVRFSGWSFRKFYIQSDKKFLNMTEVSNEIISQRERCIIKTGWLIISRHDKKKVKLHQKSVFSNLFSCPLSLWCHHHNKTDILKTVCLLQMVVEPSQSWKSWAVLSMKTHFFLIHAIMQPAIVLYTQSSWFHTKTNLVMNP